MFYSRSITEPANVGGEEEGFEPPISPPPLLCHWDQLCSGSRLWRLCDNYWSHACTIRQLYRSIFVRDWVTEPSMNTVVSRLCALSYSKSTHSQTVSCAEAACKAGHAGSGCVGRTGIVTVKSRRLTAPVWDDDSDSVVADSAVVRWSTAAAAEQPTDSSTVSASESVCSGTLMGGSCDTIPSMHQDDVQTIYRSLNIQYGEVHLVLLVQSLTTLSVNFVLGEHTPCLLPWVLTLKVKSHRRSNTPTCISLT